MLSRISSLSRFGYLIRQLNTSTQLLTKETISSNNESSSENEVKQESNASNQTKKVEGLSKKNKNAELIKKIKKDPNNHNLKVETKKIIDLSPESKETYNSILKKFSEKNSTEDLIIICKELNNLVSIDPSVSDAFAQEAIKSQVSSKLFQHIKSNEFSIDAFITIGNYVANVDLKQFGVIENVIQSVLPKMNIEQLLNVITFMRTAKILNPTINNPLMSLIREKVDQLENFESIMKTVKLFQSDKYLLKSLDAKIMQMSDKLTTENWIELLNTHSIIKYRNKSVIETCVYNLNGQKIDVDSIQKCFLSCGILNYRDDQFMKFLLYRFRDILNEHKSEPAWVNENKKNLFSIISSLGMLNLREKKCLNELCEVLVNNCEDKRVLINFVITCGSLNYDPYSIDKVIQKIELSHFNLNDMDNRERMFLLNYVWSLCMLKKVNDTFLKSVLSEDFWKDFISQDANSNYLRPFLVKLLNVNLYSQLFLDSYKGPLLPETINAGTYADCLIPEKSSLSNILISTLSSYRSAEKYFKTNLLTPFGIVIDALMVINENGIPCLINDYFNEEGQLETKNEKEKKIAFKIVEYRDTISIDNKLSGNLSMQLLLLKELDYTVITVTQNEFLNSTVIQRVNSIRKKLEKAAKSH